MFSDTRGKAEVYTRYPLSNTLIYNGTTILHYLFGTAGIIMGYNFSSAAYTFSILYLLFSLVQMYVLMPLMVCPNCVYYRTDNSLCVSGLNIFSKRIAKQGEINKFSNRAKGLFCHNNLYMAALFIPVIAMIPAVILNFSFTLLIILLVVLGLLLFRFFVIFPKTACIHCMAKKQCPNAQVMGLSSR
ncbi:hypothetical protein ACFL0H_11160 [Thermodesulfobacteriota bacterium]